MSHSRTFIVQRRLSIVELHCILVDLVVLSITIDAGITVVQRPKVALQFLQLVCFQSNIHSSTEDFLDAFRICGEHFRRYVVIGYGG